MTSKSQPTLRRTEIREILGRHKGSKSELAGSLGVSRQAVTLWLAGKTTSERIAEAAKRMAERLSKQEQSHAA